MLNNPIEFAQQTINAVEDRAYLTSGKFRYDHMLVELAFDYERINVLSPTLASCNTVDEVLLKLSCSLGALRATEYKTILLTCPATSRLIAPSIEKLNNDYEGLNATTHVTHDMRMRGKLFLLVEIESKVNPISSLVVVGYLNYPMEELLTKASQTKPLEIKF